MKTRLAGIDLDHGTPLLSAVEGTAHWVWARQRGTWAKRPEGTSHIVEHLACSVTSSRSYLAGGFSIPKKVCSPQREFLAPNFSFKVDDGS